MTRFSKLPTRMLQQTAVHSRRSSTLVAAGTTFPFTQTVGFTYTTPGLVLLKASSLAATLSVVITGTVDGSPDTETVTISHTGSQKARSTKRWTYVGQIAVAATQDGSLEAQAVGLGGEPVYKATTLDSSLSVRLFRKRLGAAEIDAQGNQITERWVLYTNSTDVEVGDRFVIDSVTYEVEHVAPIYGQLSTAHHTEAYVRRIS